MNETNPSEWINVIERIGLPLAIILFLAFLGYRYFNVRIKLMEREFDHKIKSRRYNMKGTVDLQSNKDTGQLVGKFDADVEERD